MIRPGHAGVITADSKRRPPRVDPRRRSIPGHARCSRRRPRSGRGPALRRSRLRRAANPPRGSPSATSPERLGALDQRSVQHRSPHGKAWARGKMTAGLQLAVDEANADEARRLARCEAHAQRSSNAAPSGIKPSPHALSIGGDARSSTSTVRPARRAAIATARPAGPPPTTTTSFMRSTALARRTPSAAEREPRTKHGAGESQRRHRDRGRSSPARCRRRFHLDGASRRCARKCRERPHGLVDHQVGRAQDGSTAGLGERWIFDVRLGRRTDGRARSTKSSRCSPLAPSGK